MSNFVNCSSDFVTEKLNESISVKQEIINDKELLKRIERASRLSINSLKNGKKIIFIGNGGSASDSQHLAAEFVGKFNFDRKPLSAIALNTNTSIITSVGNDYDFDLIFARQIKALGREGDTLFCLSTSGNSVNIINAIVEAKKDNIVTVGLTGEHGGEMKNIVDVLINIPSKNTPRIQESHICVGHIICEMIENYFFIHEKISSPDKEMVHKKELLPT